MTTASETTTDPAPEPALRTWCCGTPITDPHATGCPNEPKPDEPIDYDGEVEVIDTPTSLTSNADTKPSTSASKTSLEVIEHDILDGIPEFVHEAPWPADTWIEFEGDRLAFRVPRGSAVTGFTSSQSKYVPNREKGDNVQLFLRLHLSPESFDRVIFRMMHPASEYTIFTLAKLVEAILTPGIAGLEAELEAGPPKEESDDEPKGDGSTK